MLIMKTLSASVVAKILAAKVDLNEINVDVEMGGHPAIPLASLSRELLGALVGHQSPGLISSIWREMINLQKMFPPLQSQPFN